jgi:hypothetical protein
MKLEIPERGQLLNLDTTMNLTPFGGALKVAYFSLTKVLAVKDCSREKAASIEALDALGSK